ncbi:MAG TPA: oxygen-independent coproporphyrinogen III oxidase-like protein [Thiotrichaceae bacterium]|jgi:oxygen-independent coproporphyrinogen-3 oxidase|nr:oxygen-independent coproporphyrinogen III oxidase-like protein [Thiotrichaceae bacterium]HIM08652.1 oxygen-independent coproporphyrinogen III oxidase-like protein [Gammaproteobacteria bacterium]
MTSLLTFHENPPLSLYIHLPWCVKKCPYCDFNSHEFTSTALDEDAYIDALIRDLETELPRIWGRTITSVFIGGGTPSLFSVASLNKLLSALRARLNISSGIEITLEANPGTAEAEKFRGYRDAGINRLSIGVQSFDDKNLKALGRIHGAGEAHRAIHFAKDAGFENFNIDLMFALPNQSIDAALQDLQLAVDHAPTHISWYQLTIEPNTVFYSKPPKVPSDDMSWSIQKQGQEFLRVNHYAQYEISAYAKDKQVSAHNMNYWEFGDYLGIGAGAHGKITNVAEGKIERFTRHKIPKRYIELAGSESVITGTRKLEQDDLSLEFMMNAMRLSNGIPANLFIERAGIPIKKMEKELFLAEERMLLDWRVNRLQPTVKGQRYLNELLEIFVK